MAQRFEHPADLPVAPFVNRHVDDATIAAHRHDAHLRARGAKVVQHNPAIQTTDVVRGEPAGDRGAVRLFDAETWVKQAMRELAVVGQQQRAARCVIEPADRNDRGPRGEQIGDGAAAPADRASSSPRRPACARADRSPLPAARTTLPSTSTRSPASTSIPSLVTTRPLTRTAPLAISSSAPRRDATPACAKYLLSRIPAFTRKVLVTRTT